MLYTDGLVERRESSIDAGIEDLVEVVRRAGAVSAEDLADTIVRVLGPASASDDLALLVLRTADGAPTQDDRGELRA